MSYRTHARTLLLFALTLALMAALTACSARSMHSMAGAKGADMAPPAPPMAAPARAAESPAEAAADPARGPQDQPTMPQRVQPRPGQLTAGEWSDLDNWGFWGELMGQGSPHLSHTLMWGFHNERIVPVVVQHNGQAAADVEVRLISDRGQERATLWTARTDAQGRAWLFATPFQSQGPSLDQLVLEVDGDAYRVASLLDTQPEGQDPNADAGRAFAPLVVSLPSAPSTPDAVLDLMFVVDTTGSMGDELRYLQSELKSVIERVETQHEQRIDVRTSVNFYRDHGDEYVVRSNAFETDMADVMAQIDGQRANGGGDFPEAVSHALVDGVMHHDWSRDATARLLFLILDAPPHRNPSALRRLHTATRAAAAKGIRVIPVVASGIDKPTEFLMRSLAISTGGTYTFITDHSGIGNSHLKATVGPHNIEYLNDMLVRLILNATAPSERVEQPISAR